MSSEIAIRARDISKHYVMFARPEDRLKQMIVPRLQRMLGRPPARYFRDFTALNGVSFDIRRGETIGIVGRNGSGKSTLLQIVCGTLQPTGGSIEVNGRIAALLELGAGFNPEFTGRENVYLNAAILGLSRSEIDARFDDIARFADIGSFIEQPVRTYSSGMYVRLAFATAINVDPDILVVDEALAVGDEAFQRKCYARIEQIKERGGTILFVSHAAHTIVQLCDRAMLIDAGEKILEGTPKMVVNLYHKLLSTPDRDQAEYRQQIKEASSQPEIGDTQHADSKPSATTETTIEPDITSTFDPNLISQSTVEYQINGAIISNIRLTNAQGKVVNLIIPGETYNYTYDVEFMETLASAGFGMAIKDHTGYQHFGQSSAEIGQGTMFRKGTRIVVQFPFRNLFAPGTYFGNAGVGRYENGEVQYAHRVVDGLMFRVVPDSADTLCSTIINLKAGPVSIRRVIEEL